MINVFHWFLYHYLVWDDILWSVATYLTTGQHQDVLLLLRARTLQFSVLYLISQNLPWGTSVLFQPAWTSPVPSQRGWAPWQWCRVSPAPWQSSPEPSESAYRHPGLCDCSAAPPPVCCTASPSSPSATRSSAAAGRPSSPPGTPALSTKYGN